MSDAYDPGTPVPIPWLHQGPLTQEHDACAIVASIRTSGESTHGSLKRTIEALGKMGHRSGDVHSEGDGCGILTDIPRVLWATALDEAGRPAWLAEDRRFFVGHLMIPEGQRAHLKTWQAKVLRLFAEHGADLLIERPGYTRQEALGRLARAQEPIFWQVAGVMSQCPLERVESTLFDIASAIEWQTPIHVASLSNHSVIYKVRGSVETLYHYYPELRSRDFTSGITIGHARYSTNTTTAFERVQPFSLLGHNGEINTIARLREMARMLGAELIEGGSDSQDLNRVLELLIHRFGFSLIEALEIAFPPILSEIAALPAELQQVYTYYRSAFGPLAQGPAAIIARHGDLCIGSVDALGLRPLWFGQTEKECFFSSEKGVVPIDLLNDDPKPLAPGEKLAVRIKRNTGIEILTYPDIQRSLLNLAHERLSAHAARQKPRAFAGIAPAEDTSAWEGRAADAPRPPVLAAFGWSRDDHQWVRALAEQGRDPLASTGYDGPLAALSTEVRNLSDYFKEQVAVVTNPAIDREREKEHFSLQTVLGPRPSLRPSDGSVSSACLLLDSPLLAGGHSVDLPLSRERYRRVARECGTLLLEDAMAAFTPTEVTVLSLATRIKEPIRTAVTRLARDAIAAVEAGARLLVLDDGCALLDRHGWILPHLAVAVVDKALRTASPTPTFPESHRRAVGLIVSSAAFRNLHDIILAIGLGADAVAPYLLLQVAWADQPESAADAIRNTLRALNAGLEKITSTMGIHELRGYGRIFASVGLSTPLVEMLDTPNYAGSAERGLTWEGLDADVEIRRALLSDEGSTPPRTPRFTPLVRKPLQQIAAGAVQPEEAFAEIRRQEKLRPVALRHIIAFNTPAAAPHPLQPDHVDAGITGHSLPFVFASMSFGSQGETVYRAYAEAAKQLNIIALNGEGGEIEDLMGRYPYTRGQQIASGRFGVTIKLLNASNLLEIKVGQGAKPGEGGHLPGSKVSARVARARHVNPGTDLISPSNNHDIYSIEDLAQFIEELKTANPKARVAVKVPAVAGIGVIAVGIAKAGADIITLSGYDGGTGAARAHSIQHVGLPAEIGITEAHRAVTASHMRRRVELWADGGVRSPDDVVKLMCLGANRVGFGTVPMIALGCVMCRNCQLGECPVGITTQIASAEEAAARGVKRFSPQDGEVAVASLVRLFRAFGAEVKAIAARLGVRSLQELVGRSDLLEQISHFEQLNLQDMLTPAAALIQATVPAGLIPLRRPRNHLTTMVSNLIMEAVVAGEHSVAFEDGRVTPVDRALGTHLAGALTRHSNHWDWAPGHSGVGGQQESWRPPVNGARNNGDGQLREAAMRLYGSSVPGNGLGAFNSEPIAITVEGGAQDGVGKGLYGGRIAILKGYNHDGLRIDGSVGKGLAYGAIRGTIIVQGNADSRACVRLSGADVIIGGEITTPLDDTLGLIGARANVKGFLCEYMTAGRVLVLGDPGPWICAGMTGGVLYLRLQPEMGLDEAALRRRLASGADAVLGPVTAEDGANLEELLTVYADELARNHQSAEAQRVRDLLQGWETRFVKVSPIARPDCDPPEAVAH